MSSYERRSSLGSTEGIPGTTAARPLIRRLFEKALGLVFVRFVVAGGTAALVHWGVLWVGIYSFGMEGTLASSAGFLVAAVVSYLCNYFWTFRASTAHSVAFPRFLLIATTGFGLNALVFASAHYGLAAHYLVAQACATILVLFWNFTLQRAWSFTSEHSL